MVLHFFFRVWTLRYSIERVNVYIFPQAASVIDDFECKGPMESVARHTPYLRLALTSKRAIRSFVCWIKSRHHDPTGIICNHIWVPTYFSITPSVAQKLYINGDETAALDSRHQNAHSHVDRNHWQYIEMVLRSAVEDFFKLWWTFRLFSAQGICRGLKLLSV